MKIPAGHVMVITAGEYSSFGIQGFFKTLKEIDHALIEKYRKKTRHKKAFGYHNHNKFIAALIRDGYLEIVEVPELDLDSEWHDRWSLAPVKWEEEDKE